MNTYPQHISDKANAMLAKGAKMSFEAICEMFMKSEAKTAKKSVSSSNATKWAQRASVETATHNGTYTQDIAEINRANAIANMPSSIR